MIDGQTATNFLFGLASRVGPSSGADDIPREIRRQQWSVFNVIDVVSSGRRRGLTNVGVDRAQS